MQNDLISVIILNYEGGSELIECVESVFQTIKNNFEIILIDNNSSDNSHLTCKQKFPSIRLIENDVNLGITARNIGLKHAQGNFIVFLDSDTVVEPDWLLNLQTAYNTHGDGLYQPKILKKNTPDVIDTCGNMINIFALPHLRGREEKDTNQYDSIKETSYTSGACTFTSALVAKKIGGIDEIFFLYHDDVDFGWRSRLLGIPCFYVPNSTIFHLGSPNLKWSKKKFYYLERNRWICLLTLYSTSTFFKIFPFLIILEIGMLFYFLKMGMLPEKIKAFFSLIKNSRKISKRKKLMMKTRRISDKEIIKYFPDDFVIPAQIKDSVMGNYYKNFIRNLSSYARKLI